MNDTSNLRFAFDPEDLLCLPERKDGRVIRKWWICQDALLRNLKGLTEAYLRKFGRPEYANTVSPAKRYKDRLPDTGRAWRWARLKGRFYYCFDNIPDQAPARYKSQLPPADHLQAIKEMAAKSGRLKQLEILVKDRLEALQSSYLQYYYGYTSQQMQDLSRACAALDTCLELGQVERFNASWLRDIGEVLDTLGVRYLPTNWRRLGKKIAEAKGKGVWEVIDLPRADNQNARKLNDPEVESWVIQMRGMPQNFSNAHIIRKIRQVCALTGKREPSESWLSQMLAQPATRFLTSAGRYGERGRLGQIYREYTPVSNAIFANDCWQLDGTRVNFIPWMGEDGREKFLYMVVCRDVHSGQILGASFSLAEDRWMYIDALGMAARLTKTLPYEVAIDRFPGHNTPEWQTIQGRMEAVGVRVSYKHTATAKAQLERWFGTLQSVFFQESPYYYGEGIQSRRAAAHRSAEYIKAVRKIAKGEGWDMDAATKEAVWCISKYNTTVLSSYSRKHSEIDHSPEQLYQTSEKPHSKTVTEWQHAMLFGLMKKVSIRNSMVKTEIQKSEYHYAVRDYEVLKNHKSVWLAYDLEDLTKAWLFEDDDKRIMNPNCLCEVDLMPRVQVFGPDADYKQLGRDKARQTQIEERRAADLLAKSGEGSEVGMLLNGFGRKAEAEASETNLLLAEMNLAVKNPVLLHLPEEETQHPEQEINVARMVLDMM